MRLGSFTIPALTRGAKIGAVAALLMALAASGLFGGFLGASGGASAPVEKGDIGGVPTAAPSDGSFAGDRIDVVRNGSFGIEVDDVDKSIAALTATIEGKGGYLAGSYRYADGTNPAVTVTFRLPASSFDATVLAVRAEGRVLSEQISTYEVTMQLVDLEARLRNLRASEAALIDLMAQASSVSDVLAVQTQLTAVRSDIESYDAQRAALADQVAMATLSVTVSPVGSSIGSAAGGFDLGREMANAVANLIVVGRAIVVAAINLLIVALPIALLGALLGGLFGRMIAPLFSLLRRLIGLGDKTRRAARRR